MAEQKIPAKNENKTFVQHSEAPLLKQDPVGTVKAEQKSAKPDPGPAQEKSLLTKIQSRKILQRLADLQEVAIAIDTFEDLFSDFDPREYTKRDISDDFLREIRHRYKETQTGTYEVVFYAPKAIHNETTEKIIIQRLKQHFRHINQQTQKDIRRIRGTGLLYVGFGIILLSTLTLLTYLKIC